MFDLCVDSGDWQLKDFVGFVDMASIREYAKSLSPMLFAFVGAWLAIWGRCHLHTHSCLESSDWLIASLARINSHQGAQQNNLFDSLTSGFWTGL